MSAFVRPPNEDDDEEHAEKMQIHPFKWESPTKWTPAGILAGDPHPLAPVIT
jgi:hypothetical protein